MNSETIEINSVSCFMSLRAKAKFSQPDKFHENKLTQINSTFFQGEGNAGWEFTKITLS